MSAGSGGGSNIQRSNDDSPQRSPRSRNDSKCDDNAECLDSPRSGGLPSKIPRSRSPAAAFMTAASPPRFVSFEELMTAADSAANMALAHEIAVDSNFKLEKYEAPEKSIERQVKETMFRAFWDSFQDKLDRDPPDYSHALTLLQEVKEMLFTLLLPSHDRVKQHIDERIDLELVKQQLEQDSLDLHAYASFVIEMMAKLCAPVRDEQIADLRKLEKPVEIFKHIFEILELMKMDMANFTIMQMRPYIQQQSVQYERTKFQQFLDAQRNMGIDGLELTQTWLRRCSDRLRGTASDQGATSTSTPRDLLTEAYMELLDWDEREPFPETMVMDESRFLLLGDQARRLCYISAIILVTCNLGGQNIASLSDFKKNLKEHVTIILQDVSSTEFPKHVESIADQVVKDTNDALASIKLVPLDENRQRLLRTQIKDSVNKDHPVHNLIRGRLLTFIKSTLASEHREPLQIPQGLSTVGKELSEMCGALMRLIAHNRSVFGPFYSEIIEGLLKPDANHPSPSELTQS